MPSVPSDDFMATEIPTEPAPASEDAELIAEARSWASEPWAHDNWADLMNKLAARLEALAKERDEARDGETTARIEWQEAQNTIQNLLERAEAAEAELAAIKKDRS